MRIAYAIIHCYPHLSNELKFAWLPSLIERHVWAQSFTLNLEIILGPLSPPEAALCKQLLNGLKINLGQVTVVVIIVVFVPGKAESQAQEAVLETLASEGIWGCLLCFFDLMS